MLTVAKCSSGSGLEASSSEQQFEPLPKPSPSCNRPAIKATVVQADSKIIRATPANFRANAVSCSDDKYFKVSGNAMSFKPGENFALTRTLSASGQQNIVFIITAYSDKDVPTESAIVTLKIDVQEPLQPNSGDKPPSCVIARQGVDGYKPMLMKIIATGGTVSGATLNGQPVLLNNEILLDHASGQQEHYYADVRVTGPGGTSYCGLNIYVPTCNLFATANQPMRYEEATASFSVQVSANTNSITLEADAGSCKYVQLPITNPSYLNNTSMSYTGSIHRATVWVQNISENLIDKGYCFADYQQPTLLALSTVTGSWKSIDNTTNFDNSGQQVLVGAGQANQVGNVRYTQYLGATIFEGTRRLEIFDPLVPPAGIYQAKCPSNAVAYAMGPRDGGDANQRVIQLWCRYLRAGLSLVGSPTERVVDWESNTVAQCPVNQVIIEAWRYDVGNGKKFGIKCKPIG